MKQRCPTCGRDAEYLVHNVRDGSVFCPASGCAPPSFNPHGILTMEDQKFLGQCGVDPQLSDPLKALVNAAKNEQKGNAT